MYQLTYCLSSLTTYPFQSHHNNMHANYTYIYTSTSLKIQDYPIHITYVTPLDNRIMDGLWMDNRFNLTQPWIYRTSLIEFCFFLFFFLYSYNDLYTSYLGLTMRNFLTSFLEIDLVESTTICVDALPNSAVFEVVMFL